MIRRLLTAGVVLVALLVDLIGIKHQAAADSTIFVLQQTCPRGFELTSDNRCELRTLYQFYDSTQSRGVGGTHTGLPAVRDGFSPQQIDLGRLLFFDPVLSVDGTVSCASCHRPDKGFTDGQAVSLGVAGKQGTRSAPSLWNTAFLTSYFWDARSSSLEQQAAEALYSQAEMANTPTNLLQTLNANPIYQGLFQQAFNSGTSITLDNLYTALAAFQTSLISLNSRYDRYAHGDHAALNSDEVAGLNVFRSFVARCAECHTPPLFTNNQIAVIGVPDDDETIRDVGAEKTYGESKLKGGFKVPTLRNIEHTAPYMHSGNFTELRDAIEFYNLGRGHAVPKDTKLLLHWHITSPDLSDHEIDLLVGFMACLSDQKFMPTIPNTVPSGLTPINHLPTAVTSATNPRGSLQ
ncbi:cytochrome-c peroxidase [Arenicella xantha]|uniref:Cytochrome c peroxidase n=1 Tax=Arenicella xantha TaxID=644221 RepID=A0A395JH68_9GAMM|nr:cytochrome c peroxidase [Arenicella xantha]RBP48785.1 cytochrome c peroxidase [Arenicella xantha]